MPAGPTDSRSRCSWRRWAMVLVVLLWLWMPAAIASPLTERVATFPDWQTKPPTAAAQGELIYPNWFAGTWQMTSTLVAMTAPLAPTVTTPGYAGNRRFLNQPITCQVRFVAQKSLRRGSPFPFVGNLKLPLISVPTASLVTPTIVSDRAFNGQNLATAYLGDRVFRVWIDPRDRNRQITKFRDNRKLFSTIVGRASEQPDANQFIATELFDQFFQSARQPYKNQVETTTAYTRAADGSITADQMTAVYLQSPHPKAYLAGDRPVALYRYRLHLVPSSG